jgi:hypothetical protein
MNWLKDHVYVAGWLSPTIALIGMILRNITINAPPTRWSLVMIYVAFLTCMAAVFTPALEPEARFFAGFCFAGFGFFICAHAADDETKH